MHGREVVLAGLLGLVAPLACLLPRPVAPPIVPKPSIFHADKPVSRGLNLDVGTLRDAFGAVLPEGGTTLVVYGGECISCSAKKLNPDHFDSALFEHTIVLFEGTVVPPTWTRKKLPTNVTVVLAGKPVQFDTLMPTWPGQWWSYRNGRLVDFEKSPGEKPRVN